MVDVIVCGHLCLDLIPLMDNLPAIALSTPGRLYEIGEMNLTTGGAVSNTGLALHRLGTDVRLMSTVGNDLFGDMILSFIGRNGSQLIQSIRRKPASSAYTIILSPSRMDRTLVQYAGTNATFTSDDIDYDVVAQAKIFHLGYPPLLPKLVEGNGIELERLYRRVKATGIVTSLDTSFPDPNGLSGQVDWLQLFARVLPLVDIFVPSIEEIVYMLRRADFERWHSNVNENITMRYLDELADEIFAMGNCAIVGFKLGAAGIYLRTGGIDRIGQLNGLSIKSAANANQRLWHPAFEVNANGTTGAGDAAYAGLMAALIRGMDVKAAMRWSCAVGACSVEAAHASSIPTWDVIAKRLESGWRFNDSTLRHD